MTTRQANDRPLYRVTFSRITGRDRGGNDTLSYPREIGAVWSRKDDSKGGIIALDLIPIELTQRQCVLFLVPVEDRAEPAPDAQ